MPRRFTLHTAGADEVVEALGRIDRAIIQLFALVGEGVAGATHSLLPGDREAARSLAESDEMIDTMYREVEQLVQRQLAQRATGPEELRYLVTVLRMLPDLERSGDLAEHVSRRPGHGDWSSRWARWRARCGGRRPTPTETVPLTPQSESRRLTTRWTSCT